MNSNTRTGILLGLLAVLGLAVAYDFFYARPLAQKIYDEVFNFCNDTLAKNTTENKDNKPRINSPGDIHKMLGEKFRGGGEYLPSKVTVVPPSNLVETYSVMGGAVFRSHDVHVVYSSNNPEAAKEGRGEARFSTVVQGEFPQGDLLYSVEMAKNPSTGPDVPLAGASMSPGGRPRQEAPPEGGQPKEGEKEEGEAKPEGETKPEGEAKPEENPSEEKPTEEKPAEENPAEEKPAEEKPAEEKPAEEKPAENKPPEEEKP